MGSLRLPVPIGVFGFLTLRRDFISGGRVMIFDALIDES